MSEKKKKAFRLDLADLAVAAGAVSIVYGFYILHPALGYIVPGLALAAYGVLKED